MNKLEREEAEWYGEEDLEREQRKMEAEEWQQDILLEDDNDN